MSWQTFPENTPELAQIHIHLVDQLNSYSWSAQRIWGGRTSVFTWSRSGAELAFDIRINSEICELEILTRTAAYSEQLRALVQETFGDYQAIETSRFRIATLELSDTTTQSLCNDHLAAKIIKMRNAIDAGLHNRQLWTDSINGETVAYSERAGRKDSPELIVVFSSIRTNRRWLDFDGPTGESLKTNRARLLFVHDDSKEHYTYNLAWNSSNDIFDATTRFLEEYCAIHNFRNRNLTIAGMSKGGTAAIAYGLRLRAANIVALAPQICISRYLKNNRPEILAGMVDENRDPSELDQIFDREAESFRHTGDDDTAIHILTSYSDPDCTDGLPHFLSIMPKSVQVDVWKTNSTEATSHHGTVLYLTPLFLALLSRIAVGVKEIHTTRPTVNPPIKLSAKARTMPLNSNNDQPDMSDTIAKELRELRALTERSLGFSSKLLWEAQTNRQTQNILKNVAMSDIFDEIQSFIEDQQLSFLSTVRKVAENRMSFSRFGDGEIRLMLRPQYDLKFQKNSPQLAESLRSVLTDSSDGLLVGFPHFYREQHWSGVWSDVWRDLKRLLGQRAIYGNSHVSRPVFFETHGEEGLNAWRDVWHDKAITVVTGRGSNFDLVPELFSNSRSTKLLESVPQNAYADIDRLVNLLEDDEADLVLISLGPAGTVLSHRLSQVGRWAIDIGHISDSYRYAFNEGDWPEAQYNS